MQTLMPNFPLFTTPLSFFITLAAICVPLGVFLLYKAFKLPDKKEEEDFKRATKYGVREYESYQQLKKVRSTLKFLHFISEKLSLLGGVFILFPLALLILKLISEN